MKRVQRGIGRSRLGLAAACGAVGGTLLVGAGGAAAQAPQSAAAAPQTACSELAEAGRFPETVVSSARLVGANDAAKTPEFCEVVAILSPAAGSHIGVVYRLPTPWNGKILGYGGGGWAGNIRIETAALDLARGYATMQTDGGHPSPIPFDASWTAPGGKPNEAALNDYAWRAVHTMTERGKQLVSAYYGRPEQKAYFEGCSSGGRMGLMEAQRFPNDYDGIISGAPVYSLRVQLAEIYRDWIFAQPGAAITPAQIGLIHRAVLATCDEQDGLKDGILTEPGMCRFDPAVLKCGPGQAGDQCLTEPQITAVRREYEEVRGPDGQVDIFPFTRGSEPGWLQSINISADPAKTATARDLDLRMVMFGDPNFDFATFDPIRDTPRARSGAFAKYFEAVNLDLHPFLDKGGKLILWHGLDDQLPSPWGTVAYYKQVESTTGAPEVHKDVRFFLAPGVMHCGGGPGANSFDMVAALDTWVEHGDAPERIVGVRTRSPFGPPDKTPLTPMSRPICAYPALPRYVGKGDPNDEHSFVCR
jgi:feruloyl esterase